MCHGLRHQNIRDLHLSGVMKEIEPENEGFPFPLRILLATHFD